MNNSMFYLPFVLLSSFGSGGLKPTPRILKAENVQTLPVYTDTLIVSGVNKSTSTLFIGGNAYNLDKPIQYTRADLNTEENVWQLYLEINDTSRVGTSASKVVVKGEWMYGGENREYTLTFPYNNPTSQFFSFGIVINYGDPQQPPGTGYYWKINSIIVSHTTPIQWNQEVLDIPSVIFTIFTLPFTFMTKAFDFTIFPGTPYQVNFANLILLILGGITFIFIIHFLFKTFR